MVLDYGISWIYICVKSQFRSSKLHAWPFSRSTKEQCTSAHHQVRSSGGRAIARSENWLLARLHARFSRSPQRYHRTHWSLQFLDHRAEVKLLLDTHVWIWAVPAQEIEPQGRREIRRDYRYLESAESPVVYS